MGSTPFDAQFSDLSTDNPTVWEWSFGDGGSSTDQDPVHSYTMDGTYTVTLTASSASRSDTQVRMDYITVPEPAAWLQLAMGGLGLLVLSARRRKQPS